MAVFRVEKNQDYTVMSNYHLRDSSLSLKAKGLLSQMLSLPDGWDYTLSGLSEINRESKDAIRSAVVELETAGYIQRRQTYDKSGKFAGNEYVIREHPTVCTSPLLDFPTTENPLTENPTELNKDVLNTDISKKKSKKEKAPKPPKENLPEYDPMPDFKAFIENTFPGEGWGDGNCNKQDLYEALQRFNENRVAIKRPIKSKAAVTALCNKLKKHCKTSISAMVDLLDTATGSGWQSVYPSKQQQARDAPQPQKTGRVYEEL